MNIETYIELAEKLTKLEEEHKLYEKLASLVNSLNNLASSPAEPTFQTQVAETLVTLEKHIELAINELTPADLERVKELGGGEFFSETTAGDFRKQLTQNAAMPAAVSQFVSAYLERRLEFYRQISLSRESLEYLGFDGEPKVETLEAQIGFTFPRELFSNELDGLIGELKFANRLIQNVAEAGGLDDDTIEVGQISTSDPLFWFVVTVVLGKQVAGCITWALDRWKTVEEIRHARAVTEQIKEFHAAEITELFDKKIIESLDGAIEAKIDDLLQNFSGRDERKNVLKVGLRHSLKQLLARLERGLTVQVKLLEPPRTGDEAVDAADDAKQAAVKEEYRYLAQCLVFPPAAAKPVLALEKDADDVAAKANEVAAKADDVAAKADDNKPDGSVKKKAG